MLAVLDLLDMSPISESPVPATYFSTIVRLSVVISVGPIFFENQVHCLIADEKMSISSYS